MNTQFIDSIRIFCRSGNGGKGSAHLLRNKFTTRGGPDGGDGGRGGHIVLEGDENLWTLHHLRYRKHIFAKKGENGAKQKCTGKTGEDVIIKVPLGSVGIDDHSEEHEVEILEHGEQKVWIQGGKGGLGNVHFTSSVRQTPTYAQTGEEGWEGWKRIELKLLADVGLVGFPNAGKSTLLSVLSAARPKIANYPFTTLTPQLGIVGLSDERSFCMTDLPGIIECAWKGKGLGHRFLRHIERNAMLAFVISAETKNLENDVNTLKKELEQYNKTLVRKPCILILTKADILSEETKQDVQHQLQAITIPFIIVSSVTLFQLEELKEKIWTILT